MNIVLTMAGKYSRFKLFGSKVPKYLLPLGSETILAEIIKQFMLSCSTANILLVANRDDQIFFPVVRSIMTKYGISNSSLIYIDDTSSQLRTALNASELIPNENQNTPVAFANIDTVLFNRNKFFVNLEKCNPSAAQLDTFRGESDQYSYIRLNEKNNVVDIVDKKIISNYACSGLYGFGSYSFMAGIAGELLCGNPKAGFTDLYQMFILSELDISFFYEPITPHTVVLGTPEEYVINIHRFK